jgi:hypothetical protein
VFLCHTVPDEKDLDAFDTTILEATEWTSESMKRGGSVYAMTWGRDTTIETADRFARMVDADLFVIGHHPCDEGFRRANDRVIALDATDPQAACMLIPTRDPLTMDDLISHVRLIQGGSSLG